MPTDPRPLGDDLNDFTPPPAPGPVRIDGRFVRLERLDPDRHAEDLFTANQGGDEVWDYLGYGPFTRLQDYRDWQAAMALSPDGTTLAAFDIFDYTLELLPTPGSVAQPRRVALDAGESYDYLFGPIWLDATTVLLLDPGGQTTGKAPPVGVLVWPIGSETSDSDEDAVVPLAAQAMTGGTVLIATDTGVIQRRQAPSGSLIGSTGTPLGGERRYDRASFSTDGGHVALVDQATADEDSTGPSTVRVLDVGTGAVRYEQTWPSCDEVDDVAFAGDTLLVSHSSGAVDLIAELGSGGHAVIQTAGNRSSTGSSQRHQPVIGPDGLVGFPTRAGLELFDLTTQRPIATVAVPPALMTEPAAYAFSADGSTLIAASFGDTNATALVRFLSLDTDALVRQICAPAGGTISAVDWSRRGGDQPPEVLACQ